MNISHLENGRDVMAYFMPGLYGFIGGQTTENMLSELSHRGVMIWWPIYISRGFSADPFNVK